MREICTSGSEGGGAHTNELSLPLSFNLTPSLLQVAGTSGVWEAPSGAESG